MNLANSWFRRRAAERRARARRGADPDAIDAADVAGALAVREAVARLPRRQRQVVVLRYYLGWSVAEVAATTESTAGAVAAMSYRALERLRAEFDLGTVEAEGGRDT